MWTGLGSYLFFASMGIIWAPGGMDSSPETCPAFLASLLEKGFFKAASSRRRGHRVKPFRLCPWRSKGDNLIAYGLGEGPANPAVTEAEGEDDQKSPSSVGGYFVRQATGLVRQFSAFDVFAWSVIFFPWLTSCAGIFWVTPDYYPNGDYYASLAA